MAQLSQQVRPLLAMALIALLLVLVCVGSLVVGGGSEDGGGEGSELGLPPGGPSPDPSASGDAGGGVTSYSSDRPLADEASRLLESYRSQDGCALREAGFLDLFGNTWTCTVQGPGWVDVCLVSGGADSSGGEQRGSDVRVVHMDTKEWEQAYGQESGQ